MNLSDLLRGRDIDPEQVLVLRHTPKERKLRNVLRRLAAEKPEVFNAYQQTQGGTVEHEMTRAGYVASFIGHKPGIALFVGLYSNNGSKPIKRQDFWQIPAHVELKAIGVKGWIEEESRPSVLWFDLALTDFCAPQRGKLIIRWPPTERHWHRWAYEKEMPILAILKENALGAATPDWDAIDLTSEELGGQMTPTPLAADYEDGSSERAIITSYRILRDTEMARRVKRLHNYECQVCGQTLILLDGSRYAEAHHIRPLGGPHNGPDRMANILCLCPNHHAELDYVICEISVASLRSAIGHNVGKEFVGYHNERVSELRSQHCKGSD